MLLLLLRPPTYPRFLSLSLSRYEVLGGGRIERDDANRAVKIFGHSYGFPWQGAYRHDLSATVVRRAYPGWSVEVSDEGY